MRTVLLVAYYFPPSGGPGVQRVLKYVQYLAEHGWRPVVLTVDNGDFPARDESLLAKVPPEVPVERVHIYEPYGIYRKLMGIRADTPLDVNAIKKDSQRRSLKEQLAELVRATLFIPDARMGWLLTAVRAGRRLIEAHDVDVIYSSSPPYTGSLVARQLKRATGLPWVAGLRDPWTGFLTTPKRWALPAAIDRALERSVLTEADLVECAWEGIALDALAKYPQLDPARFVTVPNGFDSSDFPQVEPTRNERFTLTYTGSMYGRRNPASVLRALELLVQRGDIDPGSFLLRFVGRFGAEVHAMFESSAVRDAIEVIGYTPHDASIEYLLRSDLLLLVVDEAKESANIVPGKVFEYLGTRRPILAVAPLDSAVARLIGETGAGEVVHQSEPERCAEIILRYHRTWQEGGTPMPAPGHGQADDLIGAYERRALTGRFAEVLAAASEGRTPTTE